LRKEIKNLKKRGKKSEFRKDLSYKGAYPKKGENAKMEKNGKRKKRLHGFGGLPIVL